MNRTEALRAFLAGYLHGRSSLGDHSAAGREAEAAFNKWWEHFRAQLASELASERPEITPKRKRDACREIPNGGATTLDMFNCQAYSFPTSNGPRTIMCQIAIVTDCTQAHVKAAIREAFDQHDGFTYHLLSMVDVPGSFQKPDDARLTEDAYHHEVGRGECSCGNIWPCTRMTGPSK